MMVMGDQGGRTAVANFLWIYLDPFSSLTGRQKVLFSKYYYGPIVAPFASAVDDDDESGGGVDDDDDDDALNGDGWCRPLHGRYDQLCCREPKALFHHTSKPAKILWYC